MPFFTLWTMSKPLLSKSFIAYVITVTLIAVCSVLAISGCSTIKEFSHVRPTGSIKLEGDTIKAGFGLYAAEDSTAKFVTAFSGYILLFPQTDSLYCGELLLQDTVRNFEWKLRLGCVNYAKIFRKIWPKDTVATPNAADPNRIFLLPVPQPTSMPSPGEPMTKP